MHGGEEICLLLYFIQNSKNFLPLTKKQNQFPIDCQLRYCIFSSVLKFSDIVEGYRCCVMFELNFFLVDDLLCN